MSTATTTAHPTEDRALRWFRRLVWAGIVGNIVLGAHRFNAVFAVVCRFAGTIFMTVVGGHYIIFGLFDFIFGAPQAIFLYFAWRGRYAAGGPLGIGTASGIMASLLAAGHFGWGDSTSQLGPG